MVMPMFMITVPLLMLMLKLPLILQRYPRTTDVNTINRIKPRVTRTCRVTLPSHLHQPVPRHQQIRRGTRGTATRTETEIGEARVDTAGGTRS